MDVDVERIAQGHVQVLVECLDVALRALAPFMPHLSDELYRHLSLSFTTNVNNNINATAITATAATFPNVKTYFSIIIILQYNIIIIIQLR